jgi:chromatin remodeling complex protein RSC6
MATIETLAASIKSLHRDVRKIRQMLEDPTGEKADKRAQNSGFKKPIPVSDALAKFVGQAPGTLMSRSDVTHAVNEYATAKNLKQGQKILVDDTLKALLQPPEGFDLTFMNLQRFLKPHYLVSKEPEAQESEAPKEAPKKPRVAKPKA